jgi:hypothetical protein
VVESSALLKRRSPKGYRGFESLPHRHSPQRDRKRQHPTISLIISEFHRLIPFAARVSLRQILTCCVWNLCVYLWATVGS